MQHLPQELQALADYRQFILYKLVFKPEKNKTDKLPVDHRTLQVFKEGDNWQQDPNAWTDVQTAINLVDLCGEGYGVGFFFTVNDPFFFVDIDSCLQDDNNWSPIALELMRLLSGAAVEVSQSGKGLHIFGTSTVIPPHGCKNKTFGIELYTSGRFVALTGLNAVGNAGFDCSYSLPKVIDTYFPAPTSVKPQIWTTQPRPEWTSPGDDEALIQKALSTTSVAAKFGNAASFRDLWENNIEALADAYPPITEKFEYDQSTTDSALAQHLAFWTGGNCEHILNLMWRSGLIREKWALHKNYLTMTITRAVSLQEVVYTAGTKEENQTPLATANKARTLSGSKAQISYANTIREEKLAQCGNNLELIASLCPKHGPACSAAWWIENKHLTPQELTIKVEPVEIEQVETPTNTNAQAALVEGYQYLPATQQIEFFKNCVYVQDAHKIFTPRGALLKTEQFNATYGGYVFQLDSESSGKTTRKAWEAFTESQVVRFPKAESTCFRPLLNSGELIEEEGRLLVNRYVPIKTKSKPGDVTPFLTHLYKILPDKNDQDILLAYLAACVQHKGCKFQWAPLLQGAQGNGKTLFTRCVTFAIGMKYTHLPFAKEITEKFNAWLFDKLFIGVNDVYVPEHKAETIETLKPMITDNQLAKRDMRETQVMYDVYANFLLNANDKTAIRIIRGDRRFAPFYTAQQSVDDILTAGMGGDYFPKLYNWLRSGGYEMVNHFLTTYQIPNELNPALEVGGLAQRAPETTSTSEAISASMGTIEQEILEAVEEGRQGFSGGWISSMALEKLLKLNGSARKIPHNKRRDLLQALGYDWHPGLQNGRVNNAIPLEGGKPRLYIKIGHISANLTSQGEIIRAYQVAQEGSVAFGTINAAEKFK